MTLGSAHAFYDFLGIATVALSTTILAATPTIPPFGIDLSARDLRVSPDIDFFSYVNGKYLSNTSLPNDQVEVCRRCDARLRTEAQLHDLMTAAARHAVTSPTDLEGKVGTFYATFLDEAAAEQAGAAPLGPELDAIRAAPDREGLAALMGKYGLDQAPFAYTFDADLKNPRVYSSYV